VRFVPQVQLEGGRRHGPEHLGGGAPVQTRGATAGRREWVWNYEGARPARGRSGGLGEAGGLVAEVMVARALYGVRCDALEHARKPQHDELEALADGGALRGAGLPCCLWPS
jgi:hypothetical protein